MTTKSPNRWVVLATCCLSLLIVGMDVTIVNVALPDIGRQLHASVSGLQWVLDAYTLTLAVLLMLSGSTADRLGRRRVFQVGLALFTLGSLACSLAPTLGLLVTFRALQAVGGSMLNPVALSIISNTFTDRRDRARAIGVWGGVVGLSLALGPVVGGALVTTVGWRAVFWINIPIGLAAIVLTQRYVTESRAARARRYDPVAQVLVLVLLAALTYAIIEGPYRGWGSPLIAGLLAVAVAALAALVGYERRRREPLVDVRFFRSVPFSGATLAALAAFGGLGGFLFLNTLYLQEARGFSALHAGVLTIPMAGATAVCAPLSGRLVGATGPRLPLLVAGPAMAAGAGLLVASSQHTPVGYLVLAYLLFGIGFGLVNAPISTTAMSGMPDAQAGVAAAVASTARQVGAALGVAVVGSLVATSADRGFVGASHAAWAVVAGCGVVVLLVGLVSTGAWARGTAVRAEALLTQEGRRELAAAR